MSAPLLPLPADASAFLFDICGTLFRSNTSLDFLDHATRAAGGRRRWRFHFWRVVAGLARRAGLASPAAHMRLRIRTLRGWRRMELEPAATHFVNAWLPPRRRAPVWAALEAARATGRPVAFATCTLDLIADALAAPPGLRTLAASRLAYDPAGRCTGRYATQLHDHGKWAELCAHAPADWLRAAWYVTDDADADREVLAHVRYPVVIPPARPGASP